MQKKNRDISWLLFVLGGFLIYRFMKPIPNSYDEQLTKNFRLKEFHSHDGSDMPRSVYNNIKKLAVELQKIRDIMGVPLTINSGYRSPEFNAKVDGAAKNSMHMYGKAADISAKGERGKDIALVIMQMISRGTLYNGGVGTYKTFCHYDIGDKNRRWVR